jgi:hypothetical protein
MKALSVYIQLNNITLKFCESFSVEKTWDNFTDTADIVVPNVIFKSETSNASVGLDALLQRGDPVEVKAGYNKAEAQLETLFKGFISDVQTGTLIKIKAQDAMYALKQKNLTSKLFKKVTLEELIDYCVEGIDIEVEYGGLVNKTVVLGDWVIENNSFINPVQVLQKLKSDYGFVSYVKDGVLNIGTPYSTTQKTHYLLKELNFAGPDSLVNEVNDTLRVLKGVSILPDNSRIIKYAVKVNEVITVGDSEVQGELRTLTYYNQTASELEETLKTVYQTTNFTGLKGDFTTFGEPVIRYNDYIKLRDLKDPERDGTYKVRKVVHSMSPGSGLRQTCTVDYGISEIEAN